MDAFGPQCAKAVAIEANGDRRAMIGRNATALGTPRIDIVETAAPAALIGRAGSAGRGCSSAAGLAEEGVFEQSWKALKPGGRLVANAVTA